MPSWYRTLRCRQSPQKSMSSMSIKEMFTNGNEQRWWVNKTRNLFLICFRRDISRNKYYSKLNNNENNKNHKQRKEKKRQWKGRFIPPHFHVECCNHVVVDDVVYDDDDVTKEGCKNSKRVKDKSSLLCVKQAWMKRNDNDVSQVGGMWHVLPTQVVSLPIANML